MEESRGAFYWSEQNLKVLFFFFFESGTQHRKWRVPYRSSWTGFVHFFLLKRYAESVWQSRAALSVRIAVFHKRSDWISGSQAVFDVGCLLMTQHLSVSLENGPDLGWKNLFRLRHLFNGTFLFPFSLFLFFFFFSAPGCRAIEIYLLRDMTYHTRNVPLKYTLCWQADKVSMTSRTAATLRPEAKNDEDAESWHIWEVLSFVVMQLSVDEFQLNIFCLICLRCHVGKILQQSDLFLREVIYNFVSGSYM